MKAASIKDIKKELETLELDALQEICMRLAKYKKENKELLTYLLFDAGSEDEYVTLVKEELDAMFKDMPTGNAYYVKKNLRKILRFLNRQIKYSGENNTELMLRLYFCLNVRNKVALIEGSVLHRLYQQQLAKVNIALAALPEDLQADYQREVDEVR